MTQVARHEDHAPQQAAMVSMIERVALDPNIPLDRLEQMLAMKERMEDRQREDDAREAQRQFFAALAEAQNEIPVVLKNKANDQTRSRYADLAAIEEQAMPVIRKHGFAVSAWPKPGAAEGYQRVAFRVAHRGGHFDEVEDDFALDDKGAKGVVNKTALHAKGSTVTYARRYLLTGYFNIATADDDGNRAMSPVSAFIDDDQYLELRDLIVKAGIPEKVVLDAERIADLGNLPAKDFDRVRTRLATTIRNKGAR